MLARPAKQISSLLREKPAILRGSTLPPPLVSVQSCESRLRSSGDSVNYGVSDHHRTTVVYCSGPTHGQAFCSGFHQVLERWSLLRFDTLPTDVARKTKTWDFGEVADTLKITSALRSPHNSGQGAVKLTYNAQTVHLATGFDLHRWLRPLASVKSPWPVVGETPITLTDLNRMSSA